EGFTGYTIPLNFSRGKTYRFLSLEQDLSYIKRFFSGVLKDTLTSRGTDMSGFLYTGIRLRYTAQSQQARQHINPRYAQSVLINFRQGISVNNTQQFAASGNF